MAIVKKYRSEVYDIKHPFSDIYVVSFKSDEKPYKYLPGQFLHLALDDYNPSEPWPESRCFSMQSCDEDEFLKITYSVKGAFTGRMAKELAPGRMICLKLPYGELFTKPHSKESAVFVAGGTGITPFLSLFGSSGFSLYANPVLYLGVRSAGYNIYGPELEKSGLINKSFRINIECQDSEGMLDIERIYNDNGGGSVYFISGPPLMTGNFKKFLLSKGLGTDMIRTDDWE